MNTLTAHFLNNVIAIFMLAPLIVLFWRGGFMLLLHYNTNIRFPYLPAILEIGAGIVGVLVFSYTQVWMGKVSNGIRSPVAQLIVRRWYSYFFSWCVVCEWKGVWRLWDIFMVDSGWKTGLASLLTGVVPLLLTRCFRNAVAPPLATVSDLTETFFLIPTRFHTKRSKPIAHFLDNVFSIAVVIPLITCTWRGLWLLLDECMAIPPNVALSGNERFWSYMASTISGLVVAVIAVLLQKPASMVSIRLEKQERSLGKIIFEDVFMAVAVFASVDLWRGIWGLYDEFFFPAKTDYVTSAWLSHIFGYLGLALMFHTSSAVMKGVQYDGEHTDGAGCWFPAKCLSVFDHFIQPSDGPDGGRSLDPETASLTDAVSGQPVLTVDDLVDGDACETAKLRRASLPHHPHPDPDAVRRSSHLSANLRFFRTGSGHLHKHEKHDYREQG